MSKKYPKTHVRFTFRCGWFTRGEGSALFYEHPCRMQPKILDRLYNQGEKECFVRLETVNQCDSDEFNPTSFNGEIGEEYFEYEASRWYNMLFKVGGTAALGAAATSLAGSAAKKFAESVDD